MSTQWSPCERNADMTVTCAHIDRRVGRARRLPANSLLRGGAAPRAGSRGAGAATPSSGRRRRGPWFARAGGRGGRHARREAAAAGGALELGDLGLEHGDGRVCRAAVAVALGHVRVDRLLHEGRRLVDRRQDAARRGVWSHSRMHESRVLRKSTGRQATLMVVPGTT